MDRDEALAILPFDDAEAARFVVFLTEEQLRFSWQLIECDGTRLTKGPAAVRLLELLAPTRLLGRLCRPCRLTGLIGLIDHAIDVLRPWLSRIVPDKPGPRRWP
ncbi:MAG: hypothetical protein M3273_01435 [Actinomycetota bacterium]|nr:hypothetical protein [Actinomycetota bacterium]